MSEMSTPGKDILSSDNTLTRTADVAATFKLSAQQIAQLQALLQRPTRPSTSDAEGPLCHVNPLSEQEYHDLTSNTTAIAVTAAPGHSSDGHLALQLSAPVSEDPPQSKGSVPSYRGAYVSMVQQKAEVSREELIKTLASLGPIDLATWVMDITPDDKVLWRIPQDTRTNKAASSALGSVTSGSFSGSRSLSGLVMSREQALALVQASKTDTGGRDAHVTDWSQQTAASAMGGALLSGVQLLFHPAKPLKVDEAANMPEGDRVPSLLVSDGEDGFDVPKENFE